jgi:hypothetical protein
MNKCVAAYAGTAIVKVALDMLWLGDFRWGTLLCLAPSVRKRTQCDALRFT